MYGDDGPATYDGFISYSHAADDLLAPRLQAGLQRFAKPWWKRRAVRIFRDETSLAANPHLWASITDALDDSGWFVLLLSEDAARSEWVGKEIEYWIEHKPADRILPVVTDGEFNWTDRNVAGSSVPAALHRVFTEEPRWVDLRFARGEENLDLKNPTFAAAVADVASAIRGIPKDELESEEVRQHRRTIRTAWASAAVVLLLGIAAAIGAIVAVDQSNEAKSQRDEANRLATAEAEARAEADTNAAKATANAALANARELAASAIGVLGTDPELATLLAIQAIDESVGSGEQPVELINALWAAGQDNRLLTTIEHGYGGHTHIELSHDESFLIVTSEEGASVQRYDTATLGLAWEYVEDTTDSVTFASIHPNDGLVAISILDAEAEAAERHSHDENDGRPNRVQIIDASSGELLQSVEYPDCTGVDHSDWSPDGEFLAVGSGLGGCERAGVDTRFWVEISSTSTWEPVAILGTPENDEFGSGPGPTFDTDGSLVLLSPLVSVRRYEAETFELMETAAALSGFGALVPDRDQVVLTSRDDGSPFDVSIYDVETGEPIDRLRPADSPVFIPFGITVSDNGHYAVIGNESRDSLVFALEQGDLAFRLPGGAANDVAIGTSTERVYTGHLDGRVSVWDISDRSVGTTKTGDLGSTPFVNGNTFAIGDGSGAFMAFEADFATPFIRFFDTTTGEVLDTTLIGDEVLALDDGTFVYHTGPEGWRVHDPATGTDQHLIQCPTDDFETCRSSGEPWVPHAVIVSFDGSEVIAIAFEESGPEWIDVTSGVQGTDFPPDISFVAGLGDNWILTWYEDRYSLRNRLTMEPEWEGQGLPAAREVSPGGRFAAFPTDAGATILDTETATAIEATFSRGRVRGLSFNPDETRLAIAEVGELKVLDVATGAIVQSVNVAGVSDVHWLDDGTLLVGTSDGVFGTISIDTDEFLAAVRTSLRRSFTTEECRLYRIDPCPTLTEIQSR